PAVDITAIGQVLVDNVTYGSFTEGYLELPPISATLNVTPAEDNDTIVASFAGDLTMLGGQAITALASGFLDPAANQDGAAFDILIVLADGTALTLPVVTDTEDAADVPNGFSLLGNYPNPFNPTTTIAFDLPSAADVTVDVYNATGQQVMTMSPGFLAAGANQSVTLNALDLPSGLYLYRVTATTQVDTFSQTGRMLLLK
ncbi:MAG: T9SS type A sorting domain-containing protein, partial [Bacteroidota bacterium]